MTTCAGSSARSVPATAVRVGQYLDAVREIEQRIQKAEHRTPAAMPEP